VPNPLVKVAMVVGPIKPFHGWLNTVHVQRAHTHTLLVMVHANNAHQSLNQEVYELVKVNLA